MLSDDDLIQITYEYYYKYKKILLLLNKIGFQIKESTSNEWYYKDYYFVFMHTMNSSITGIYDTMYLNKQVDINFYHNNLNHFSGLKLLCTTTDKLGNEVYELNYFETDIYYLTESDEFQKITDKIITQLNSIFRKELRSIKIKKLYN